MKRYQPSVLVSFIEPMRAKNAGIISRLIVGHNAARDRLSIHRCNTPEYARLAPLGKGKCADDPQKEPELRI
jgi:hypothetical protein